MVRVRRMCSHCYRLLTRITLTRNHRNAAKQPLSAPSANNRWRRSVRYARKGGIATTTTTPRASHRARTVRRGRTTSLTAWRRMIPPAWTVKWAHTTMKEPQKQTEHGPTVLRRTPSALSRATNWCATGPEEHMLSSGTPTASVAAMLYLGIQFKQHLRDANTIRLGRRRVRHVLPGP